MKMSVEEAQLILNVKKGDSMEKILEVSNTQGWCPATIFQLILAFSCIELRADIQGERQTRTSCSSRPKSQANRQEGQSPCGHLFSLPSIQSLPGS